jgi:hypothetical protein
VAQITLTWLIKIFELDGTEVCTIEGATDQTLSLPLNGIDSCSFTVWLDNENANELKALRRTVKVWRTINDPINSVFYTDPPGTPCFAGIITRCEKAGQANTLSVLAQSPFWRLQGRFHRNNWKLVIDYAGQNLSHGWDGGNMDGLKWDVSALCWRLIDLVNHQLGSETDVALTGIIKPTTGPPYWEKTIQIANGRNVRRGNWVWDEIQEMIFTYEDGNPAPDLIPEYINRGDYALMYFKTSPQRGSDVSSSVSFDFCTGASNLDDFVETEEVVVGKDGNFSNFVWAVGNNDPETHRKVRFNQDTGDYSVNSVGNYMFIVDSDSEDMVDETGILDKQAKEALQRLGDKPVVYAIEQAALKPPYYGYHYGLGDLVMLNASKGALSVSNVKQRIYEVILSLSDNCVETASLRIASDFHSKVPES